MHAVTAALEMQSVADRLSLEFVAKGWPGLSIGIGVNSGLMRVGDMGSNVRRAYTVMGDAVNLGSRLEGLTKVYGVRILIGEQTRRDLREWTCREVDRVKVKGKDHSVSIYEPLGPTAEMDPSALEELLRWNEALKAYRAQDWMQANQLLGDLKRQHPDRKLYDLYLSRIETYSAQTLDPDWDGSTRFDTK